MPKIGEMGCDLISMALGLGTAMLVGTLTGLHYYPVFQNSGDATGIGFAVGIGAGFIVGSVTWIYIRKSE